jgi:hypothetical protein
MLEDIKLAWRKYKGINPHKTHPYQLYNTRRSKWYAIRYTTNRGQDMKISKKQKAVLKSYARGVLVSFLTFLASNELGLDPVVAVVISALAGPAVRALDKSDNAYGIGADVK